MSVSVITYIGEDIVINESVEEDIYGYCSRIVARYYDERLRIVLRVIGLIGDIEIELLNKG